MYMYLDTFYQVKAILISISVVVMYANLQREMPIY